MNNETEFKQGELIEVRNGNDCDWLKRVFVCKHKDFFICESEKYSYIVCVWNYARKIKRKPLEGHNPSGVTELPQGCIRLLDADEVGTRFETSVQEIFKFDRGDGTWYSNQMGYFESHTYATSLTREELAEKRGLTKKKEPTLVAWESIDEVPLNAWFRCFDDGYFERITAYSCEQMTLKLGFDHFTFEDLKRDYTYSNDLKTWHPCGKEVQS